MFKKTIAILGAAVCLAGTPNPAAAATGTAVSSQAKIVRIGSYGDGQLFYLILDRPIFCYKGSVAPMQVQFVKNTQTWNNVLTLATAALLSGRTVEISTQETSSNGACIGYALEILAQ